MMQEAPSPVLRIGIRLEDIFQFLRNVIAFSAKLSIVQEDEGKLRMDVCKADKKKPICLFSVAILPDGDGCELHFTPIRKEDSSQLAGAIAALVLAISEYNRMKGLRTFKQARPKFEVTESHLERIATFLQVNGQSTFDEIADVLGMEKYIVAVSLQQLIERGIAGYTRSYPRVFFLK